jgi:hypothetical protein
MQKRGRKARSEYSQPYPNIHIFKNIPTVESIPEHNKPSQYVVKPGTFAFHLNGLVSTQIFPPRTESIVGNIGMIHELTSVISSESILHCTTYLENDENGIEQSYTPDIPELALIICFKACVYQSQGKVSNARQLFEKGRDMVMSTFDTTLKDIITATSFLFLSCYSIQDDDRLRAEFYIQAVTVYLTTYATRLADTPGFTFLKMFYTGLDKLLHSNTDIEQALKLMLYEQDKYKHFGKATFNHPCIYKSFKIIAREDVIDQEDVEKIEKDLIHGTSEYQIDERKIELIEQRIVALLDKLANVIPEKLIHVRRQLTRFVFLGLLLQRNMAYGAYDVALQRASEICTLTLQNIDVIFVSVLPVLLLAAQSLTTLLNYVHESKKANIYNSLSIVGRALCATKNSIIGAKCVRVVNIITTALQERLETASLYQFVHISNVVPEYVHDLFDPQQNQVVIANERDISWETLLFSEISADETLENDVVDRFFEEFM